jgi:hypothetical protein
MTLTVSKRIWCILAVAALFLALPHSLLAAGPTVLVVSVDPLNPTYPHTTYATSGTTEISVILGATVPSAVGSTDAFTYSWNFGDGSAPTAAAPVTNPYNISATHQYPASAAPGTAWQAVVTVKDTTNNTTGTATYYITQETNTLNSRVNVAIDWGLWYMHETMWRNTTTAYGPSVNWGGWDTQNYGCTAVNGSTWDCSYYGAINADNVQAFEVSGHFANGPASDPFTDDVARGLARMTSLLVVQQTGPNVYNYNPAISSFTCADNSIPQTTDSGACTGHGGQHQYNAGATSCPAPPCSFTFDGNSNGQMVSSNDYSYVEYETSPYLDALVASANPGGVAVTGPAGVIGKSYKDLVQDIEDYYEYSQYYADCDVTNGNTRGNGGSCAGGAWYYTPQGGDDSSASQWAAIALISGQRGFGLTTPKAVTDFNNVWITNAQDVQNAVPTGADPYLVGADFGAYGYRGSFYYSNAWGAFAVTPSSMVQMAMDGIGRTKNTAFGDSSTDFDQRWNNTETFYADNFCNNTASGAYYAPRNYIYGLYSFTKAMLLHAPGGSLTPITTLRTLTPGVFPSSTTNSIDWYAAVSPANGGTDDCDGVAQTLIGYQLAPPDGTFDGHWYGNNYDDPQNNFETAWAIIMLRKTVFVTCINNLYGQGTAGKGTVKPPRVDLTWSGQTNATSYNVLRGTVAGGPYTQIGTSTNTGYSDIVGLTNGQTYYYVVQPVNGSSEICQSNQEPVTVP